jgi:hypothetical protein
MKRANSSRPLALSARVFLRLLARALATRSFPVRYTWSEDVEEGEKTSHARFASSQLKGLGFGTEAEAGRKLLRGRSEYVSPAGAGEDGRTHEEAQEALFVGADETVGILLLSTNVVKQELRRKAEAHCSTQARSTPSPSV